ncbi:MAG: PBP1A family penicillin-binding protein [Candidatus Melainabacteria bacterium]|nr:PBP1A family penicillin-binding protein [Candidatus Melainabacteria bacterium]
MRDLDPQRYNRLKSFNNVKPVVDGFWMIVRVTVSSITLIMCVAVCVLSMCVWFYLAKVPNISLLENYHPGAAISVYDIDDKLICVFPEKEKREIVSLTNISRNLVLAVLAQEDHYFYEHHGVSPEGILRAALANITARKQVQGGSTLTQQLVKNVFYPTEGRNIPLKLAEGLVANQIENRYSKDRILELYLNQIYFGQGAYGAEQAAKTYFAKSAKDLTVGESAFLAAIIKAPTQLGDRTHRMNAIKQQQSVVRKLFEYGFITQREAWDASHEQLTFISAKPLTPAEQFVPKYPYYTSYIAQQVESTVQFRKHSGLKVYTNLDQQAQKAAEKVLSDYRRHLPIGLDQAAVVSMRLKDGAVLAMVGGLGNYLDNQWNSAVHPHTMGSSFKPFVYLTAFEQRILTPASTISDAPLMVLDDGDKVWQPANFDKKFMGLITVEQALAYSRNVCSVRVAQQTGIHPIIDTARRAGITETLAPTLALSLGASAASPLSMATAYGTLARGGMYIEPQFIRRVENEKGREIFSTESRSARVLDEESTVKIVEILKKVVDAGTGTHAKLSGIPVAGKTGTANDAKDLWFVGFTPDLVTAVWTGNSENKSVPGRNVTGGTVAAGLWKRYNLGFYSGHSKPAFSLIGGHDANGLAPLVAPESKKMEAIIASPDTQAILDAQSGSRPVRVRVAAPHHPQKRSGKGVTEYNWQNR